MDPSVQPQVDFHRHVNGAWVKSTEIPANRPSAGAGQDVVDRTQTRLRTLVEGAATEAATDPDTRQFADRMRAS